MKNKIEKERVEIKYRIDTIKVIDFTVQVPEGIHDPITDAFFEFNSGIQIILNENKINIKLQTKVYDLKTKKTCYSYLTLFYSFNVIGMKSFQKINDMVKVPDKLMLTLMGIAYSTTRGVFFEKFAGTCLRGIFLPPMDPQKLIPKPIYKKTKAKPVQSQKSRISKEQITS